MKIAKFQTTDTRFPWVTFFTQEDFERSAHFQKEYVQLSEWVDVDFPPLNQESVVQAKLRVLDAAEVELRQKFSKGLIDIADARSQLLSLTHDAAP